MKTFGKLRRGEDAWILEAEAHVILRAKRMFAGCKNQYEGSLVISDTPDNARDLEWFMFRYPLEMADDEWAILSAKSADHEQRETDVIAMLADGYKPKNFKLATPPREYQKLAAEMWLRVQGLLLGDDAGLGKTATSICALVDKRTRPALVVTLTALPQQWQREIRRFAPDLEVHVLRSSRPYTLADARGKYPDVIVTSYSKITAWAETLRPFIKTVIWDEAQELRRAESDKWAAAKAIADGTMKKDGYRIALTATPIYNYGEEVFNVMECVAPGALGTETEFKTEHCSGKSLQDAAAFSKDLRARGLMLRRTRSDVKRELPAFTKIIHEVDTLDDTELRKVQTNAERLAEIILNKSPEKMRGDKMRASEELSALVRHATGVAKAAYVADFVRMLIDNGEKVVLYGWHRSVYGIWLEKLKDFVPAMFTGSESASDKDHNKRRFVEGDTPVLLMSLRSGAGLDGLQKVSQTVVFGELDWSPGVHYQCETRVHRDGQENPVFAYYMLADEGSDPIVADVLGVKREQSEGLRNPDAPNIEKLEVDPDRIKDLARLYLARRSA